MATSGKTSWFQTRDQIINGALRKCQILQEGQVANAAQLLDASSALNNLVAEYRTLGMPLWKRTDLDIPMVVNQQDYVIGVGEAIDTPYPLKLLQARLFTQNNKTFINLNILPDFNFNMLPKNSSGVPVNVSYVPQLNKGTLSVWPIPNAASPPNATIVITYTSPIEVFDAATDDADFPGEWYNGLIYGLATLMSDEFALPIPDKQWLDKQSEKHLASALSIGTEDGSMYFAPDSRRN